jgi:hypothetical protein
MNRPAFSGKAEQKGVELLKRDIEINKALK